MSIQDEIIVLKEINYKDYDKILHCFSRKFGKIQIMSRNTRRINNENASISLTFNHSKVNLYKNKDMYILNNGNLVNNFYNIKSRYEAFVYSNYTIEILNHILQENEANEKLFDMTIKLLKMFSEISDNHKELMAAYEIKVISILGFRPYLLDCVNCNNNNNISYFSVREGGAICNKCGSFIHGLIKIEKEDIKCIDYMINNKFEDIIDKSIDVKVLYLIKEYFNYQVGKNDFKSLRLLGGQNYG
jgi:DNA repair protein RecO (recombination protein O)